MARPKNCFRGHTQSECRCGRPTDMTLEVINKLDQAFAIGCSDKEACAYADISHQTLYNYQAKNPEYVEYKNGLKEKPILKARQELIKGFTNNGELSLKFLERKLKGEFSLRTEHTGEDGKAISINIIDSYGNHSPTPLSSTGIPKEPLE